MNENNQNNKAYVENFLRGAHEGEKRKMLMVLDQYGDDKWWLSSDGKVLAKNQLEQPFLIIDINKFKKSIEKILGRSVRLSELDQGKPFDSLKKQVLKS